MSFFKKVFEWAKIRKSSKQPISWKEFEKIAKNAGLYLTGKEKEFFFHDLNWHIHQITEDLKDVNVEGIEPWCPK